LLPWLQAECHRVEDGVLAVLPDTPVEVAVGLGGLDNLEFGGL
jgi:hypothetical protein